MGEEGEDAELLALQRIDDTSVKLQQDGKYLEALECMERGLVLRQHFFGADSEEVWRACKTVAEMCNLLAMTYLQQEDFPMVLELLKKADILTERDPPGRAVTYNNLACYYRRQGKLHASLSYLQKSLKIEATLAEDEVENPADTHLNMCAVLSQLGRHATALEHAQSALILLQEELFGGINTGGDGPQKADRVAVLAIAYHNIGVEQEFLKKFQQSVNSYGKGVEVAKTHLGPSHGITVTLKNSLIAAKRAISQKHGKSVKVAPPRRGGKKRGKGAAVNPTDKDVEKWGNITGVYGDIPGVKPVARKGSPGKKRRKRKGKKGADASAAQSPVAAASPVPAFATSSLELPPADDEPSATEAMLDMVTPRGDPDAAAENEAQAAAEAKEAHGEESKADMDYPAFPAGCSHLLAKHLTRELYSELATLRTANGFSLSDLCQAGVNAPGLQPRPGHAAAVGVAVPDAASYEVFSQLLAPILEEHHAGAQMATSPHVSSSAALDTSDLAGDVSAISDAFVLVTRNVAGKAFAPGLDEAGRDAVLAAVAGAGAVTPLAEAGDDAVAAFKAAGVSLTGPSELDAASGAGAGWPQGRGVIAGEGVYTAVNVCEHVAVVAARGDGDVVAAMKAVASAVAGLGVDFEFTTKLGTVTSDPTLLGAGAIVGCTVAGDKLAGDVDAADVARRYGLASSSGGDGVKLWTLSGMNVGAVTCVKQLLAAVAELTASGGAAPEAEAGAGAEATPEADAEPAAAEAEAAPAEDAAPAAEGGDEVSKEEA